MPGTAENEKLYVITVYDEEGWVADQYLGTEENYLDELDEGFEADIDMGKKDR
jgi:hypothetical protein